MADTPPLPPPFSTRHHLHRVPSCADTSCHRSGAVSCTLLPHRSVLPHTPNIAFRHTPSISFRHTANIAFRHTPSIAFRHTPRIVFRHFPPNFCRFGYATEEALDLKPVLNWANVCSLNILRTVRRTMIRFLIELIVRRTWFGQFDELYFVLNWLVRRCKLRPELAADAQQTA